MSSCPGLVAALASGLAVGSYRWPAPEDHHRLSFGMLQQISADFGK